MFKQAYVMPYQMTCENVPFNLIRQWDNFIIKIQRKQERRARKKNYLGIELFSFSTWKKARERKDRETNGKGKKE